MSELEEAIKELEFLFTSSRYPSLKSFWDVVISNARAINNLAVSKEPHEKFDKSCTCDGINHHYLLEDVWKEKKNLATFKVPFDDEYDWESI